MNLDRLVFKLIDFAEKKRNGYCSWIVRRPCVKAWVERGWLTPNRLTYARVAITIALFSAILAAYLANWNFHEIFRFKQTIFWSLLVAAITDAFDGPLAREYAHLIPAADAAKGVNLDRHADKLMTLPLLAAYFPFLDWWTKLLVAVAIGGDILATVLAVLAKKLVRPIPSNQLGKAKMALLCIALLLLVIGFPKTLEPFQIALVASFTLGVASLASNFKVFMRRLLTRKPQVVASQNVA